MNFYCTNNAAAFDAAGLLESQHKFMYVTFFILINEFINIDRLSFTLLFPKFCLQIKSFTR